MMAATMQDIVKVPVAIRFALADRRARIWGTTTFLIGLGVYLLVLPATDTGGTIGLVSLRFLTFGEVGIALTMAILVGLTTALGIYGLRQGVPVTSGKTILGAIVAILPTLLCCSPILPLGIAAIASVLPAAGALGLPIQGFIATHEAWIYAIAIAFMAWGLYANARRALYCAC
ncbi:MAG: hypothetical protein B7Z71_05215 [Acidocella sp. 21-58-7]|nr:MAG: hypothetical protein B7Z76_13600 [Acidiphilium sp. 20-67-58]OYV61078.1 MAG: hypothetical protein B7Z71_05215 [Acidocella sp. 21-58-7]HQT65661.1 hypothetical protein [Acidocella sp.]